MKASGKQYNRCSSAFVHACLHACSLSPPPAPIPKGKKKRVEKLPRAAECQTPLPSSSTRQALLIHGELRSIVFQSAVVNTVSPLGGLQFPVFHAAHALPPACPKSLSAALETSKKRGKNKSLPEGSRKSQRVYGLGNMKATHRRAELSEKLLNDHSDLWLEIKGRGVLHCHQGARLSPLLHPSHKPTQRVQPGSSSSLSPASSHGCSPLLKRSGCR